MKNSSFGILRAVICLAGILAIPILSPNRIPDKPATIATVTADECITNYLDNIAGDTYAAKFKNGCGDTYRVYYQIIDGGKVIQDVTSTIVRAKSENSTGTYHCSANAYIKFIKKEAVK